MSVPPDAGVRIDTAADAYRLLRDGFPTADAECLQVATLDAERHVLAIDRYEGGRDHLDLPTRAIVARAAARAASALLVAHNHPSGDPRPSPADRAATARLAALLAGLDIRLIDHLVFAGQRCTSFRQLGLI